MRSGRRAFRAAIAISLFASLVACGSGFLDRLFTGQPDAGGIDAADDGRCFLVHLPPSPDQNDTALPGTLFLALEALRIDDNNEATGQLSSPLGIDLDETCTCEEARKSCVPPGGSKELCDADGGRDNATASLFTPLTTFDGVELDFATSEIREGSYGAVLSISGYNQADDDPKITFGVYTSRGLEGRIDGGKASPKFDGTDRWSIEPESVIGGDAAIGIDCRSDPGSCLPRNVDDRAYVAGKRLVADLKAPFSFLTPTGRIVIDLVGAKLSGLLTKEGGRWFLDGEITGRWPVSRALKELGKLPYNDAGLCKSASFQLAVTTLCGAVDLAATPQEDGMEVPCTAISTAIRFRASTAQPGAVRSRPFGASDCEDASPTCN